MKMEYDLNKIISTLKINAKELTDTRIELLKLAVSEKISAAGSKLIFSLIIINTAFFALLFAFTALGFLFAYWINSLAGGFAIITLFYLLLLLLLIVFRKFILIDFKKIFLKDLYPDLDNETKSRTSLRARSDALTDDLKNNLKYLQRNFTIILSNSIINTVATKLPTVLPFFVKETKELVIRILLYLARNR